MKQILINLSRQPYYWLALFLLGLALEAAALYYQYVLDEWPCVLCIHVRIWVFAFMLVALAGFFSTQWAGVIRLLHGLNTLIMLALVERSWQLLGVERGWIFGECDMDLGMPAWFALDQWAPWLFEVQTSCGYTPLILFNISMAEVLLVISSLLMIISVTVFITSWTKSS